MTQLTFYTNPQSRGRMVRWALEEAGATYDTKVLDYGTTMKAAEYLAINPMGKVPALQVGDTVITETAAICTWLADAFPAAGLAPALGSEARGAYLRWIFYAAGPIDQAMCLSAVKFEIPPERKGMFGTASLPEISAIIDAQLGRHAYLAGDDFTMADVYCGGSLGWVTRFGMMQPTPALSAYLERIGSRPAALRANALDDALVPKAD
jgi:glutathione S-transferase